MDHVSEASARPRRTLPGAAVLVGMFVLGIGCGREPEALPLTAENLTGAWGAEVTHNGQSERVGIVFEPGDGQQLTATLAVPAIEAWAIAAGPATLDAGAATVTIGSWTLSWDPRGPALTADLPESFVPVHKIHARFTRDTPIAPVTLTTNDSPMAVPVWTFGVDAPIWGGVVHADGVVYVGDDAGVLHAVDAQTGQTLWGLATGGPIRARPTVLEGSIYVPSDDGLLYCIDAKDGRVRWRVRVVEEEIERGKRYDHYAGAAVVHGAALYLATGDGRVHALEPVDGSSRWIFEAGDAVASTPAVEDGRVFVGSFDGKVYALDASVGKLLWQYDTGAPVSSSATVAGDRVLIGSRSYDLFAFDAATGAIDWRYYYWFSWVDSDAVVAGDTAFIGSSDALKVLALDVESGRPRWTARTGGWSWATPAVTDDAVFTGAVGTARYIGERRGGFFAFERRDGSPRWQYPVEQPADRETWGFASSPATDGERVFVGGLDGTLYAFSTTRPR